MADRKALEGIVTAFYEARAAGDREKAMSWAAPDVSFCIVASGRMAAMGQRVSEPEALDAVVQQLFADWDMSRMKTPSLHIDGDTVFAHRTGVLRYVPTGREIETEYIDRFTFKDGKIIDLTEFVDTLLIAETVGLIPS